VKRWLEIALGIVTSVGGFLEVGSIATSAQAGAAFGFRLLWAVVLGTVCLIFLIEMSGRLAAVSHHTIADAMRERFGFDFFLIPLLGVCIVSLLVLASEIGGVCLALQLLTGVKFPWWALPVGVAAWLLIWKGTFSVIEKGVSLLGLVTVAFLVAAIVLKPDWRDLLAGLAPRLPEHDGSRYWFLAVSILGASLTPYLFYFYSSGAVEDGWGPKELRLNRVVAGIGIAFGGILAAAVLVVATLVFQPRGIQVEQYEQAALLLVEPFGFAGFLLFAIALGIACFGAALEITLALAYLVAQGFGWSWGENLRPRQAARFASVYTALLILATLVVLTGIDPLKLTNLSMALTAAVLPVAIAPFLILMNDPHYMREHTNGWLGNGVVVFVIALAFVLALISIPLEIVAG
jgi:Mn2+/Fe2+ NRAMP family transporter